MLKACFYKQGSKFESDPIKIGEVIADGSGYAEPTTDEVRDLLLQTNVISPEDLTTVLEPEDGEIYVASLPRQFRGTYIWAELQHGS